MIKIFPFLISFVFTCLTFFNPAFGQDNFVSGSVVTLSGDTLKGTINDQRWKSSPLEVQFKNTSGLLTSFKSTAIKGFRIEGKAEYISLEVKLDSTSIKVDNLPDSRQPQWKTMQVFLKYIVQSKVSLLSFEANDREHFFIQHNGITEELVNHRYRTINNFQSIVTDNKMFVEQLKSFFKECSSLKITESYSDRSLAQLFIKYSECRNEKNKVFDKKDKTLFAPGLIATVSYDQFGSRYKGAIGYGAGVCANLIFPNRNYKSSLNMELIYRKTGRQETKTKSTEFYEIQSIQWTTLFRTRLLKSFSPLLVGGGISLLGGLNDSFLFSGAAPNRKDIQAQAIINTTIVGDVCFVLSKKAMIDLRYESGDPVVFKDYEFGNSPNQRSSSWRLSVTYLLR